MRSKSKVNRYNDADQMDLLIATCPNQSTINQVLDHCRNEVLRSTMVPYYVIDSLPNLDKREMSLNG